MSRSLRALVLLLFVSACGSANYSAPRNLDNACSIVSERPTYLKAMKRAERRWGVPVAVQMATIYQESKFIGNARTPVQYIWLKPNGERPDDPAVHQSMLAYASDFTLLDTALIAHAKLLFDPDMQLASLDHALWFHRPFRMDEWLLYSMQSPNAAGARGYARGQFFRQDGTLVASTTQEGVVRVVDPTKARKRSDPREQV